MASDHVMVAAIDFGTTFSGYAFSFKTKPEDIKMNKNWGTALGFQSYKTPTCVLINPSGEFESFGYEAENTYGKYLEEDRTSEGRWQLYRHFKMMLHRQEHVNRESVIESCSGQSKQALEIFTFALRYLRNHMLDVVSTQTATIPKSDLIRWVITVPAIWNDHSKQFMREAAFKAGFMKSIDSHQLLIALEPECASLYCRRLKSAEFMNEPDEDTIDFVPGTKYLVIDCGGGTIDITAHQIRDSTSVRELHSASGGSWGGTQVDDLFIQLLEEVLGKEFVQFYRKECPQQWLLLMTAFEKAKKHVKPDGESTINIPLSWAIDGKYQQYTNGQKINECINSKKSSGMSFINGSIILEHFAVRKLFIPIINRIINHVEGLMGSQNLHPLKYFFMVGGFSECVFLQSILLDRFAGRVHVLIPNESQMAVIKGAVLFGHNPDEIKSRVSRRTYGCRFLQNFEPDIHDPSKRVVYEGIAKCKDLFKVFVEKDEEVLVGDTRTFEFTAVDSEQDGADFNFMCIDRKPNKVQYIDEEDVEELGDVHVDMPVKDGGRSRVVQLTVTFGGTEIGFEAIDKTSGKHAKCKLNFLAV